MAFYERTLAMWADGYGLDDPLPYEVIRWNNSAEDAVAAQMECLAELGFPPDSTEEGTVTIAEGQQDTYQRTDYQCKAQYPVRSDVEGPATEAEAAYLYHHLKTVYVPCLADLGHPGLELPTYEVFRSRATGGEPLGIDQMSHIENADATLSYDDIAKITGQCAWLPPGWRQIG